MLSHQPKIFCLSSSTFSVLTRFFGSWLRWSSNVDSGHELKLVWKVFEDGLRHWWTALALDLIPSCLGWSAERHLKDNEIHMSFPHILHNYNILYIKRGILNNYLYITYNNFSFHRLDRIHYDCYSAFRKCLKGLLCIDINAR